MENEANLPESVSNRSRTLFEEARAGSKQALGELLRLHGPRIEGRLEIASKWQSVLSAGDVMQVTYLEAVLEFSRYQGTWHSFPAWLERIASHNLADAIGQLSAKKRPHPDDRDNRDHLSSLFTQVVGTDRTPSMKTHFKEVREKLLAEIDRLPPSYAQVIKGVYLEGKTVADVATLLGKSEGATFIMKSRALEKLAEALGSASKYISRSSRTSDSSTRS